MTDHGWLEASTWYQETLWRKSDRVDRLRLLSNLPTYSVWRDIRDELQEAANEIERLRKRVEELEEDGEDDVFESIIRGIVSALASIFERLFRESRTGTDGDDRESMLRRAGNRIRERMRSRGPRPGDQSGPTGGDGEG